MITSMVLGGLGKGALPCTACMAWLSSRGNPLFFPASLPAKVLLYIASNHDLVLCDHMPKYACAWGRATFA